MSKLKQIWDNSKQAILSGITIGTICLTMIGSVYWLGSRTQEIEGKIQSNTESIESLETDISVNKQLLIEFREFRAEQSQSMSDMNRRLDDIEKRLNFNNARLDKSYLLYRAARLRQ